MTEKSFIADLETASGRKHQINQSGFLPGSQQYVDRDYVIDHVPAIAVGYTRILAAGVDKLLQENE